MWVSLGGWAFGGSTLIKVPKWNEEGRRIIIKVLELYGDLRDGANVYFDCRISREM